MPVYNIFVINRAGGLIFDFDNTQRSVGDVEQTYTYPLPVKLDNVDHRVMVAFGEKDGVKVGYAVLAINDQLVQGNKLKTGEAIMDFLDDPENYPLKIRFGRPPLASNEKIILSSMFHSLYAIGAQLSPVPGSSGIQTLEASAFRLQCFQSVAGEKFIVVAHPRQTGLDGLLLKVYELYADYALKNPFYSLEQPIRCELFDTHLRDVIEKFERNNAVQA